MKRLLIALFMLAVIAPAMSLPVAADESDERVKSLVAALSVKDDNIRKAVITALGNTGNARAVKPLISICDDGDISMQRYAYQALAKVANADAIDTLVSAIGDDDKIIAEYALKGLVRMNDPRSIPVLVDILGWDSHLVSYAQKGLAGLGDKSVDMLAKSLSTSPIARRNAVSTLAMISSPAAFQALSDFAAGADWRKKLAVISSCSRQSTKKIDEFYVQMIINCYSPKVNDSLKASVVRALSQILHSTRSIKRDPAVEKWDNAGMLLCKIATEDNSTAIRSQAIEALRSTIDMNIRSVWESEYAQKTILDSLTTNNIPALARLTSASIQISHKSLIQPLCNLLQHNDPEIRQRASSTLLSADIELLVNNNSVLNAIAKSADDSDQTVRLNIAKTLAKIGGKQASDQLMKMLSDEYTQVVKVVLANISKSRSDDEICQALITALELKRVTQAVRIELVRALGAMRSGKVASALKKLLDQSEDPAIKTAVIETIATARVKLAAGDIAKILLTSDDESLRFASASALGDFGGKLAVNALVKSLNSKCSGAFARTILINLSSIATVDAVEPLCEFLSKTARNYPASDRRYIHNQATNIFKSLADPRCIPTLLEQLDDPDLSLDNLTIATLLLIDGEIQAKSLIKLASHDDPTVAKGIIQLMGRNVRQGDIQALPILVQACGSEKDYESAMPLVMGIARIDPVKAKELFVALLAKSSQANQQVLSNAISKSGEDDLVKALIKMLAHGDKAIQLEAIMFLGKIGDVQAVKPLQALAEKSGSSIALHSRVSILMIKEKQ